MAASSAGGGGHGKAGQGGADGDGGRGSGVRSSVDGDFRRCPNQEPCRCLWLRFCHSPGLCLKGFVNYPKDRVAALVRPRSATARA
ncbi:protein of unknown function [Azospirillum baldaniorum]|uniref:Uncharacterized protein n=1 Tax=Azospirillum baldaniorum TaxID=1064539 RepID=A0A9P1NMI9_9PROT|nr:protein of unknown function [Azospirillum baldaniorum]